MDLVYGVFMKRKKWLLGLALVVALILYFGLWPVPIKPVSWKAPVWEGYKGVHAVNDKLTSVEVISLDGDTQPEHIVLAEDGNLYAAVTRGNILRMHPDFFKRKSFGETFHGRIHE